MEIGMDRWAFALVAFGSLVSHVSGFGILPGDGLPSDIRVGVVGMSAGSAPSFPPMECEDSEYTLTPKISFCTEIAFKNYIGEAWCGTVEDPTECGCGSDTFRQSSNPEKKDQYDLCTWDHTADGGNGKCIMSGVYFMCGSQCQPTTTDENTAGNTAELSPPSAPAGSTTVISEDIKCVDKVKIIDGEILFVKDCYVVKTAAAGRRMDEEDEDKCNSDAAKTILSVKVCGNHDDYKPPDCQTDYKKTTYESCTNKMVKVSDVYERQCSCKEVTSVEMEPVAEAPAGICQDVWPPLFDSWSPFSADPAA
jgi:hypothetical protein